MMKRKLFDNPIYKQTVLHKLFSQQALGYTDIGARGGVHNLVEPLHQQVRFLGFEPHREECDALNANNSLRQHWQQFRILPYALSDQTSTKTLNLISAPTNTSLLKPDPFLVHRYNMQEKWTVIKEIAQPVVAFDELIADGKVEDFNGAAEIIKVDTQGTEYEILRGAQKLIRDQACCLVVEVEFFPIYKDQKLFSDVEILLRELGFSFYGFLTLHTRSQKRLNKKSHLGRERLFYADAVFFREPSNHNILTYRQKLVLITAAILTEFYDFALEIVSNLDELDIKEKSELNLLIDTLAYCDPIETQNAVTGLLDSLKNDASLTNLHVGKFIDALNFPDFEDVILR